MKKCCDGVTFHSSDCPVVRDGANVPHSETQCAICTRTPMQNSRYCSKHDPAPFARAVLSQEKRSFAGAGLRDNNGRSIEEE